MNPSTHVCALANSLYPVPVPGALDVKLVTSLLKAEVTKACVGRAPWEKVHAVHVLQDPFR